MGLTEWLAERLASQPTHWRLIHSLAYQPGNREVLRQALAEWLHRYLRSKGRGRWDLGRFQNLGVKL